MLKELIVFVCITIAAAAVWIGADRALCVVRSSADKITHAMSKGESHAVSETRNCSHIGHH